MDALDTLIAALFVAILTAVPVFLVWFGIRWACEDAESRGGSKLLASVLVIFGFPIGLWIWIAIRPTRLSHFPKRRRISVRSAVSRRA